MARCFIVLLTWNCSLVCAPIVDKVLGSQRDRQYCPYPLIQGNKCDVTPDLRSLTYLGDANTGIRDKWCTTPMYAVKACTSYIHILGLCGIHMYGTDAENTRPGIWRDVVTSVTLFYLRPLPLLANIYQLHQIGAGTSRIITVCWWTTCWDKCMGVLISVAGFTRTHH